MKTGLTLWFIVLIVLFFRLYKLDTVPPSPSLDEVSIGYNAYSILLTGKDEYGTKFPILLRAYDDWRPALYVYTVIPFLPVFGLSAVAVRFPAVLLSVMMLIGTYLLTKEMFRSHKLREWIGLGATFLLAISPWHIYISRLGHEVNLGLTLVVWATLLFFYAMREGQLSKFLFPSGLFFALSLYAYQSEKIVTPVIVLVLVFFFRKELFKQKKQVFFVGLVSLLLVVPLVWATLTSPGLIRFSATNVFAQDHPWYRGNTNRRLVQIAIFSSQYLSHLNPQWLFAGSAREAHKVPNLGLLYIWEAPLILLGLFFLRRWKIEKRIKWIILLWIVAAPLPGAITTQAPHAMRSYTFLPMWQVLGGIGLAGIFASMKGKRFKTATSLLIASLVVGSLFTFFKQYYVVFPRAQSDSFQYALGKAIPIMISLAKDYDQVIVSNKGSLYQSYMFYLFFTKYDPAEYQSSGGTRSGGFAQTHTIGKYEFRPIVWEKEHVNVPTLYVGNPSDFSPTADVVARFFHLDGKEGVVVVRKGI